MANRVCFVEPLFEKICDLISNSERPCLKKALTLYGSQADFRKLGTRLHELKVSKDSLVAVDLSPIMSLGTKTRLEALLGIYEKRPFVTIARGGICLEYLKMLGSIPVVVCDDSLTISDCVFPVGTPKGIQALCADNFPKGASVLDIHRDWINDYLGARLKSLIRHPPKESPGRGASNLVWVDIWIDVKSLLRTPGMATFLAYQMGYVLTKAYVDTLPEDGFVTGNNTAYVLASFLQQIFDDKELIIVDRLGPSPGLTMTRLLGLEDRIRDRSFVIVEDVISTGREVDMLSMILFMFKGRAYRAMSVFDLEVAFPAVLARNTFSLCSAMKYVTLDKTMSKSRGRAKQAGNKDRVKKIANKRRVKKAVGKGRVKKSARSRRIHSAT